MALVPSLQTRTPQRFHNPTPQDRFPQPESLTMQVIHAYNVNDAYHLGMALLKKNGVPVPTRNGPALKMVDPVTTVYDRPWQRVLFDVKRDCNPFFHFF